MRKQVLFIILSLCAFAVSGASAPPPAAEVFAFEAQPAGPDSVSLTWKIRSGFFLYADRIHVNANQDANFQTGTLNLPEPLTRQDSRGKTFTVYRDTLQITMPVLGETPGESLLSVNYQGCSDDGFCYPPETRTVKLAFNSDRELASAVTEPAPPPEATLAEDESPDQFTSILHDSNWLMIILSFTGFGLLLSFTPCVLPMVPVLSGIIVGHGPGLTHRKAFLLSSCYVGSMALTYAIAGALVAALGQNLQMAMQSPVILITFSLVFVLLALSMFGWYDLRLPVRWQAALASVTRRQGSGHYLGAAITGCLSTLVLSPCVTAPLIGVLGYIANTGNVLFGTIALFFLGLGMGIPLLLIGASAGKWLPKAGQWMQTVKSFLGLLLLAVAIQLAGRVLPDIVGMFLWASLLVFAGIGFGALLPSRTHLEQFRQGLGILLLVYGVLVLVGASLGNTNPLRPLATCAGGSLQETPVRNVRVTTLAEAQSALAQFRGRPAMIDFYANWCASCKILEATTLQDPAVRNALAGVEVLTIDLTPNNAQSRALLNHFNVVAPPTFLFVDADGKELRHLRLVGEATATEFLQGLGAIARNAG